jgi:hypothetical protein
MYLAVRRIFELLNETETEIRSDRRKVFIVMLAPDIVDVQQLESHSSHFFDIEFTRTSSLRFNPPLLSL